MGTLHEQYDLATSGDFKYRVSMAALQVAAGKLSSAVAEEAALARSVIRNPDEIVIRLAKACAVGVTVAGTPPSPSPPPANWGATEDTALVARVTALWGPFAQATAI